MSVLDGRGMTVPPDMMALAPKTLVEVLAWPSFTIPERRQAPDAPGLYCVVIDSERLIYTGVSGVSIQQRWRSRHLGLIVPSMGEPRIHYRLIADDHVLYWLEIAVMQNFHPILNGWSPSRIALEIAPDGRKMFRRVGWDEPAQYW